MSKRRKHRRPHFVRCYLRPLIGRLEDQIKVHVDYIVHEAIESAIAKDARLANDSELFEKNKALRAALLDAFSTLHTLRFRTYARNRAMARRACIAIQEALGERGAS